MYKTLLILLLSALTAACSSNSESENNANRHPEAIAPGNDTDDDYTGDDENKSYELGQITFTAEGQTHHIIQFGIDPYTAMVWFTPESGIDPTASVVFKSADFGTTAMVNFKEFDAMQNNFEGEKQIIQSQPIVSFTKGDTTYMFNEGNITFNDFSRKTGKVKLQATGQCYRTVLTNPEALQQNIEATLEINAAIPHSSVDGVMHKTEAAAIFNIQ